MPAAMPRISSAARHRLRPVSATLSIVTQSHIRYIGIISKRRHGEHSAQSECTIGAKHVNRGEQQKRNDADHRNGCAASHLRMM